MPALLTQRKIPTKAAHFTPGTLYAIEGQGEGIDMLPAHVFRHERTMTTLLGYTTLVGTLWWRAWIAGRWYSGTQRNHHIDLHHVSADTGHRLSHRHDFHLRRIEPADVKSVLGQGRLYAEVMQTTQRTLQPRRVIAA